MKRAGAVTAGMEVWHIDIEDFVDLRKAQGEDRRRAQDTFLSLSVPDLFFKRMKEKKLWTLFDPYDVPGLTETFGDEFEALYIKYEDEFLSKTRKFNKNTRQVSTIDLASKFIYAWTTEGVPFWFFKDNVNKAHKYHKEAGIIRSSNLCQEIALPTDDGVTAVCNLGSLNAARLHEESDIIETSRTITRFLDNIIDVTDYNSYRSRNFQQKYRAIGVGVLGEHQHLVDKEIEYGSDQHAEWIEYYYKLISETIENCSKELAIEKGPCAIDPNIRNAYRMAVAPNTTTGLMAGTTPSHEPVFSRVYTENSKVGIYKITAPGINLDNIKYYKNAFEIDKDAQIRMMALRQKYIDMALSNNIHEEDVSNTTFKNILKMIIKAHSLGIKTLYYYRTKAAKIDKIDSGKAVVCEGCDA